MLLIMLAPILLAQDYPPPQHIATPLFIHIDGDLAARTTAEITTLEGTQANLADLLHADPATGVAIIDVVRVRIDTLDAEANFFMRDDVIHYEGARQWWGTAPNRADDLILTWTPSGVVGTLTISGTNLQLVQREAGELVVAPIPDASGPMHGHDFGGEDRHEHDESPERDMPVVTDR